MIGKGRQKRRPGWTTLDANPQVDPDILATLPPIPDEVRGAEAFELIHVFEHFFLWEAHELLKQFREFLSPGGVLILELPNLQSAIDTLSGKIDRPIGQWAMWVLYGDPGHKNPLMSHKWAWTPRTLTAALTAAGFADIKRERPKHHVPDRDFRLVAKA